MLLPPYVNNFPSIFPKATITNFPSFYIITRIFLSTKKCRIEVTAETILLPSPSPDFAEIERYLALPCDENVEALLWWQAHSTEFLHFDLCYLAIQSTSVAYEQAFSVAGNTITKVQNRLCPETAKASLCTKSWVENNIGEQIRLK
ncbi:zinc finger BED domain-containing protein RICESLEEPER 2-like [Rhizophagus irregularis DAOM 181602=DAOM 197198]|nr:zinc finger BED domain-containing protein RICESLEEPER 2-like [Rhizophagus irregularis DAOM 181602=DAOM 197198]